MVFVAGRSAGTITDFHISLHVVRPGIGEAGTGIEIDDAGRRAVPEQSVRWTGSEEVEKAKAHLSVLPRAEGRAAGKAEVSRLQVDEGVRGALPERGILLVLLLGTAMPTMLLPSTLDALEPM